MGHPYTARSGSQPSTIGPYRILRVLGHGGMGVVYQGEHLGTGAHVALKTVLSASETILASMRREIHALSRLCHPGVVRILAQGIEGGVPWYAMELLEGRTLRDYIHESWSIHSPAQDWASSHSRLIRAAVETAEATEVDENARARPDTLPSRRYVPTHLLTLVGRLCAPLAYLHGKGLVHRDLKPENIFIREDGVPVLVDLGIAAHFGGSMSREELEVGGKIMGSLPYMAPEQILGELVDARADLYALGCILYECLTGRPPFVGGEPIPIQHLSHAPRPPSALVPGIPEELDRLAMRLLAKSPRDRLGYAAGVAEALTRMGVDCTARVTLPRAEPYLYRPDFTGREDVLDELVDAISLAGEARRGGLFVIGGESGVGKTRLVMEAARQAVQRGITVVTGQCMALGVSGENGPMSFRAPPLHPLRPLLFAVADRCRAMGARTTRRLVGDRAMILSTYEPALSELPGLEEYDAPPSLPPEAARARVLSALKSLFFAFADKSPLLLILDDLQWADELSLSFLRELSARDFDGHAAIVLGTFRREEMSAELDESLRVAGARRIELEQLDPGHVGLMVCGMLALYEPPLPLIDFLHRAAGGNPFFIAEYLRAAITEGVLTRSHDGRWDLRGANAAPEAISLPLPSTLEGIIERRLDVLDDDPRALLGMAAVLGRELDGDLLMSAANVKTSTGMDAIDALRRHQILEESNLGQLQFVHAKIREIVYEQIPEEHRRALHWRAAEAIEQRPGRTSRDASALAHHFAMARIHDKASDYFILAGDNAKAAYANREAITFYRAAIQEMEASIAKHTSLGSSFTRSLCRVYESMGDTLALTGRQDEARGALEEALSRAQADDRLRRARLYRKMGKAWETHHKHADALRAYAEAESALGEEAGEFGEAFWHEWVQIQIDRISSNYFLANVDELTALIERVRPVAEQRGTPRQRASFYQALVQMSMRNERYLPSAESVAYARACLAARENTGNAGEIANARFGLAALLVWYGEFKEAEQAMLTTLRVAERIGDVPLQSRCLTYLTMLHRRCGRVDEVRSFGAQSLAIAQAGEMSDYIGAAMANQAWVALREGNGAQAEQMAKAALERWYEIRYNFPFRWLALMPLCAVELEGGRLEEAIAHARGLCEKTQQRLPDTLAQWLERAIAAWERGDNLKAWEELTQALKEAARLGYS